MRMVLETDVPMNTRDGVVLRADIHRPDDAARRPALLVRTPYDKSSPYQSVYLDPRVAVSRGYVVVVQDVRGRGTSDGEWLPWNHETEDGFDSVDWLAGQDFCDGRVVMCGASYVGNTQWRAAASGVPALHAIAPGLTWSDPLDGILRRGGVPEHGLNVVWSLMTGMSELLRRGKAEEAMEAARRYDGLGRGEYLSYPAGRIPWLEELDVPDIGLRRADADPKTVAELDVGSFLDGIRTPALHVGGWYDIFSQGTLDNFTRQRELGVASHLIIGPWTHSSDFGSMVGEVNFGLAAGGQSLGLTSSLAAEHLDFFDAVLGDRPLDRAPVRLFVMGRDEWRDEESWPLARAVTTRLELGAAERAVLRDPHGASPSETDPAPSPDSAAPTTVALAFDAADPVPTVGGGLAMHDSFPWGAWNQRDVERRDDVLVFTTDPLDAPLEITGRVRAHLRVRPGAAVSDWVVRVCDVRPDGKSINVVDGVCRVESADGLADASGERTVTVDLWSTSIELAAGHRLRVHVAHSNFPRWGLSQQDGSFVSDVLLGDGDSWIELPVIPPSA
ncbi:CocE/NonD family hydrolase [Streptomyces sp. NBC_01485]|uniref:CocE/NonD family hydrolase n=1 Tax=Streptomyces sp. NBC_01485 TaxID=2903884 RepID=UPI002E34E3F1|nr:CocE/NonD family hydrolase [Streptomyces sp. NBC_01485]